MSEFVLIEDALPEPGVACIIKRRGGALYFGVRNDRPRAISPDLSRDCHWYGTPYQKGALLADETDRGINFGRNFQDGSVDSWYYV